MTEKKSIHKLYLLNEHLHISKKSTIKEEKTMTSKKTTRRALLSSLLSLLLCVSMLLGTTFAWFTDEVTSTGNIIKSGTLDVEMYYGDDATTPNDASEGAVFGYEFWEPGYTDVKYIKVVNNGDLAFKYQLLLEPVNAVSDGMKLAEVIDVYCAIVEDPANFSIDRSTYAVAPMTKLGTLKDLMLQPEGMDTGVLLPKEDNTKHVDKATITDEYYEESVTVCLALHMQEEADNDYQNLSIGDGFAVKLLATQYTYEKDSFDHMYDEWANGDSLVANVTPLGTKVVNATMGIGGSVYEIELDPVFQFQPTETLEEAEKSPYRYYHADFVVSADKDVAAESLYLAGYYKEWCQYNSDYWVALASDAMILANTEIRLVEVLGATVNYEELCRYGNDGIGFLCGASDQNFANVGTTLTVELRLYETTADPSTPNGPKNIETGEYMTIATYKHTFQKKINTAEKLATALAAGGEVALTQNLELGTAQITIPAGVTATLNLNGYDLTGEFSDSATYGMFNIAPSAELTVKGQGDVTLTAELTTGHSACIFQNDGTLTIEGGNYKAVRTTNNGAECVVAVIDNCPYDSEATVTINDGTFTTDGNGAPNIIRNWPIHANGKATLSINGGTFTQNDDRDPTYFWNKDDSTPATLNSFMNFNGGTYVGNVVYEDYNGQSDITVTDAAIAGGLKAYSGNT